VPRVAKENGTAKSQALLRAAMTDWLLWVFCEMSCPHSSLVEFEGMVSIWVEGSSHKKAFVWEMRDSISIEEEKKGGKRQSLRKE
jgi:hypothetical protein